MKKRGAGYIKKTRKTRVDKSGGFNGLINFGICVGIVIGIVGVFAGWSLFHIVKLIWG